MTFSRFNVKYLKLIDELDEVKFLKNEELLLDQVAKIIDEIVRDGIILPLAQERYSLYIKNEIKGIEIDYYGRPLFQGVRRK
jgi:MarR-like DNA-binding transcriptional regulator SgrR of sgrS sRNA